MFPSWTIDDPAEVAGLDDVQLDQNVRAALARGVNSRLAWDVFGEMRRRFCESRGLAADGMGE